MADVAGFHVPSLKVATAASHDNDHDFELSSRWGQGRWS
jgi:hypothetical protein